MSLPIHTETGGNEEVEWGGGGGREEQRPLELVVRSRGGAAWVPSTPGGPHGLPSPPPLHVNTQVWGRRRDRIVTDHT